jgi:NAD(P)-dependent dehydrogenase (short-subunit alcohol dehydrogenase family)
MWQNTKGLAYEYARRGARLALVARREDRLREVADKAHELGSPEAFVIRADVAKVEDCKRIVDEAVNHFGQRKYPSKEWFLGCNYLPIMPNNSFKL